MFEPREEKPPLWLHSFLIQQLIATGLLGLLGLIFSIFFIVISDGLLFVAPSLLGLSAGYVLQCKRPSLLIAGKWVWILPTVFVILIILDWLPRFTLLTAFSYTFSPPSEMGEQTLGTIFTVPFYSSCGYVAGLLIASRIQRNAASPAQREMVEPTPFRKAYLIFIVVYAALYVWTFKAHLPHSERHGGRYFVSVKDNDSNWISQVVPAYPSGAEALKVQGDVVANATVAPDGRVTEVRYLSGPPRLAAPAIATIRKWVYSPGGSVRERSIRVHVQFQWKED